MRRRRAVRLARPDATRPRVSGSQLIPTTDSVAADAHLMLTTLYTSPLALLTDLYEITMAAGYFKCGLADREGAFHLTFRRAPFSGGYAIACGLHYILDYVRNFRFDESDLA